MSTITTMLRAGDVPTHETTMVAKFGAWNAFETPLTTDAVLVTRAGAEEPIAVDFTVHWFKRGSAVFALAAPGDAPSADVLEVAAALFGTAEFAVLEAEPDAPGGSARA